MRAEDVRELAGSWVTHMEAARLSPNTIRSYTHGLEAYVRWCEREKGGEVRLSPRPMEEFIAALLAGGAEAATALSRQRGVRRFSAWAAKEEEIPADELKGISPPKLDKKIPGYVRADQMTALLATCSSRDFHDVRDEAIIRLMWESMVRSDELLSMTTDSVNIRAKIARVERGKGGKGRIVPYGAQTARALDRYARARRKHPLADSPRFWLAERRRVMGYGALYATLRRRAESCGFRLHPHMLRSTAAIEWRRKGGSVAAMLTVAGWSSLEMAQRYVQAAENELAIEEAHKLFDGE